MTAPGKPLGLDGMEAVARAAEGFAWDPYLPAEHGNVREHIATFDPLICLRLIETIRALREVAQTGRDYAKDMADGHLVSVKIDGRSTTIIQYREMGESDLARFDAALAIGRPE